MLPSLCSERLVRQSFAVSALCRFGEARSVRFLTLVEPKHLLLYIGLQMLRARGDVRAAQSALKYRPKAFNVIGVNMLANVLVSVIDNVVNVIRLQVRVRVRGIGVDRRTAFDVIPNPRKQRLAADARNDPGAHFALAFDDAHNRRFTDRAHSFASRWLTTARTRAANLVARPTADVGFVYFNRATKPIGRTVRHCQPQAVQHKPRGFLRDFERPRNLARRNAITVAGEQPDRRQPLGERNRRIFKDCPNLGRELPLAVVAVPTHGFLHEGNASRSATLTRARYPIRKPNLNEEVVRCLRIGKLPNRFQHRVGDGLLLHTLILAELGT